MRIESGNGRFGFLIEARDWTDTEKFFSMIALCLVACFLVVLITAGLGLVSFWATGLQEWPIGRIGVGICLGLMAWSQFIFPLYLWVGSSGTVATVLGTAVMTIVVAGLAVLQGFFIMRAMGFTAALMWLVFALILPAIRYWLERRELAHWRRPANSQ